jgi:hypothetical protein
MDRGLSGALSVVVAGLVLVIASTIGPNKREVRVVPETKRVAGVYSEKELAQIEDFRDDYNLAVLARVAGRNWGLRHAAKGMLERYPKLSPGGRREVGYEVDGVILFLKNVYGREVAEDYMWKICDIEADDL